MRHNGARCAGIDQGAARSDIVLSEILSRGHLRMLRDEHRRCQYLGLHNVTIVLKFLPIYTRYNRNFKDFLDL